MFEIITKRLSNDMKVAFLLYPTQINEITAVSDLNRSCHQNPLGLSLN